MRHIKSARYTKYQGHQVRVNEGETTPQAISRYRKQLAQEEADRLESERLAKEDKERARAERRRIPKYQQGDIVLGKDGRYYQVWDPYYNEEDDTVYYGTMPTDENGKWVVSDDIDDYRWWSDVDREMSQNDIQRRIRKRGKVTASTQVDFDASSFSFAFIVLYNYSEEISDIVANIAEDVFEQNGCDVTNFVLSDVTDSYALKRKYAEFDVFRADVDFIGLCDETQVIKEIKYKMQDNGYSVIGNPEFYDFDD